DLCRRHSMAHLRRTVHRSRAGAPHRDAAHPRRSLRNHLPVRTLVLPLLAGASAAGPLRPGSSARLVGSAAAVLASADLRAGAALALGWRFRVTGPVFGLLFLAITTYDNCWQQVAHTENLVTLHVLILAFAASAHAYSRDARRKAHEPGDDTRYGWPVRLMS